MEGIKELQEYKDLEALLKYNKEMYPEYEFHRFKVLITHEDLGNTFNMYFVYFENQEKVYKDSIIIDHTSKHYGYSQFKDFYKRIMEDVLNTKDMKEEKEDQPQAKELDYKGRVREEKLQLDQKVYGLQKFIETSDVDLSIYECSDLELQLKVMEEYSNILDRRIKRFDF